MREARLSAAVAFGVACACAVVSRLLHGGTIGLVLVIELVPLGEP